MDLLEEIIDEKATVSKERRWFKDLFSRLKRLRFGSCWGRKKDIKPAIDVRDPQTEPPTEPRLSAHSGNEVEHHAGAELAECNPESLKRLAEAAYNENFILPIRPKRRRRRHQFYQQAFTPRYMDCYGLQIDPTEETYI